MTFHDASLDMGFFTHGDLAEAHKLDIDSGSPPLNVAELDKLFKSAKTEMRGVWQVGVADDYVNDKNQEYTQEEVRLVGFVIYLEHKDKPTEIYRLSVHYLANYPLVATALLRDIKGPIVTTVRQRNLDSKLDSGKKLLSFLKGRGFKKIGTRTQTFSFPLDKGVLFRYDAKTK